MITVYSQAMVRHLSDRLIDAVFHPEDYSFNDLYSMVCSASDLFSDLVFTFDHDDCSVRFK